MNARVVLTTFSTLDEGRKIASALVAEGLVACVNLLPGAQSVYRWEGEIQCSEELVGIVKTTLENLAKLQARLTELHSYQVPEFVVLTPEFVSQNYLSWLMQSCSAELER